MIAIRDFKMPENCIKCPMQFGGWCYVSPPDVDERVAPTVDDAWEQGKPDWCPLVEVPDINVGKCSEIPNNSDSVSRRAEIDALNKLDVSDGVGISSVACDLQEEAIRSIENLPSAEPEIVKCKECVYADENYHCDYMTTWNDGDCFCCYGKR